MTNLPDGLARHLASTANAISDVLPATHGWQHRRLTQALEAITQAQRIYAAHIVKVIQEDDDE